MVRSDDRSTPGCVARGIEVDDYRRAPSHRELAPGLQCGPLSQINGMTQTVHTQSFEVACGRNRRPVVNYYDCVPKRKNAGDCGAENGVLIESRNDNKNFAWASSPASPRSNSLLTKLSISADRTIC